MAPAGATQRPLRMEEIGTDLLRNRRFESISLQRGVRCEPDLVPAEYIWAASGTEAHFVELLNRHPTGLPASLIKSIRSSGSYVCLFRYPAPRTQRVIITVWDY